MIHWIYFLFTLPIFSIDCTRLYGPYGLFVHLYKMKYEVA